MNIVIGKTYQIKQFCISRNSYVTADAKIIDYKKRIGQRNIVVIKINGVKKSMAVNAFKSKIIK